MHGFRFRSFLPVPGFLVVLGLCLLMASAAQAQPVTINGPAGSGRFGASVTVLPSGNFVVTDPLYDAGSVADVGAVYLYRGTDNTLISTLTGSTAGDRVGSTGVTVLRNGNFVVVSPNWDGAAVNVGAVTWASGSTGVSGPVSAANSLVGTSAGDGVSNLPGIFQPIGVEALPNGNYVVYVPCWDGAAPDVGAVTWGNGGTGIVGAINAGNSLVGTTGNDHVGASGVTVLANGNYVVHSPDWDGAAPDVGAVTWGNGSTGVSGTVSASNSLVGSSLNDKVGLGPPAIRPLVNGNYVVSSPDWDNGAAADAGAATWGNGSTGTAGVISVANSLVGSSAGDQIGRFRTTALTNGNYVVGSSVWDGAATDVGAVTWGNGSTGTAGVVSAANSLVGTTANDQVGSVVIALTNGNYVVGSRNWNGATPDVGAATWGNGSTGISGAVSAANSLIGVSASDAVGTGVTALTSGNYVVSSPDWDGTAANIGAVTWCNGRTGMIGAVNAANSLVGSTANDAVGGGGFLSAWVSALSNGNYVVSSPNWDGAAANVGAVTWGNGSTGTVGVVSAANSLVGSTANDQVGGTGTTLLANGNYVVVSSRWDGAATDVGAVTWGNGSTGTAGVVSATNSLVGSTANDYLGIDNNITVLTNGNYVVQSPVWDGAAIDVGAVTWCNGLGGTVGVVSAANSLVGSTANDWLGSSHNTRALASGNYVVTSVFWNGVAPHSGARTLGNGASGTVGVITPCNSILGSVANMGSDMVVPYDNPMGKMMAGLPAENKAVIGTGAPAAPTGAVSQSAPAGATLAALQATGTAVQWYAASSGGQPLPASTLLVSGRTYYASQTVNGCESFTRLAVTVNGTSAVSQPLTGQVKAYPNPAHGQLTVQRPAGAGTSAMLLNSLGQQVRQFQLPTSETTVELRGIAAGVYTLRLTIDGQPVAKRVIVE